MGNENLTDTRSLFLFQLCRSIPEHTHTNSLIACVVEQVACTHFLIVLDLIFGDDAVGLLWFLPGELNAVLLYSLLYHLAHLRRC